MVKTDRSHHPRVTEEKNSSQFTTPGEAEPDNASVTPQSVKKSSQRSQHSTHKEQKALSNHSSFKETPQGEDDFELEDKTSLD